MHHGFHLAQDVLNRIKATGSAARAFKVKVGEGLAVSAEELKEAFAQISANSPYKEVELQIEIVPIQAACSKCHSEFAPQTFRLDCPVCGSQGIQIISGQGIEVFPSPKV